VDFHGEGTRRLRTLHGLQTSRTPTAILEMGIPQDRTQGRGEMVQATCLENCHPDEGCARERPFRVSRSGEGTHESDNTHQERPPSPQGVCESLSQGIPGTRGGILRGGVLD